MIYQNMLKKTLKYFTIMSFQGDKYGYEINKSDKIALKLFSIAKKYPQKSVDL